MIDKRLNDKGKNWRHVFKVRTGTKIGYSSVKSHNMEIAPLTLPLCAMHYQSLTLLDYCLHVGSEDVVSYAKENMYVVKTLKEFQHIDDNGKDVGANVRQKAKDITNLLSDEVRLRDERRQRSQMRDRMAGVENIMDLTRRNESTTPTYDRPGYLDDERDLRRALEESKRLAEEEERARRNGDDDLSKALRESEREARAKASTERDRINRQNEEALFGSNAQPEPAVATNNAFGTFPQQQSFDSTFGQQQQQQQPSANPYLQQQQWIGNQATGQLELADTFSNPVQSNQTMFPQMTGYQQSNPYQQQQQTTYNPYQQQQFTGMQQQMPQVTGFGQQPSQQFDMNQQQQPQQSQFTDMQSFQQPQQTDMINNPFGQFGSQSNVGDHQQAFSPQQQQATGFGHTFDSSSFSSSNPTFGIQSATSQQLSTPSFAAHSVQPNVSRGRNFAFRRRSEGDNANCRRRLYGCDIYIYHW